MLDVGKESSHIYFLAFKEQNHQAIFTFRSRRIFLYSKGLDNKCNYPLI